MLPTTYLTFPRWPGLETKLLLIYIYSNSPTLEKAQHDKKKTAVNPVEENNKQEEETEEHIEMTELQTTHLSSQIQKTNAGFIPSTRNESKSNTTQYLGNTTYNTSLPGKTVRLLINF